MIGKLFVVALLFTVSFGIRIHAQNQHNTQIVGGWSTGNSQKTDT